MCGIVGLQEYLKRDQNSCKLSRAGRRTGGETVSNEMKEAMSKMAELINKAPEDKRRDIGNFLAGCVAGLEIVVGGSKEEQ